MTRAGVLGRTAWVIMAVWLLAGLPGTPVVGSTAAAMYQWTTPDGTIGLTDDPGRIPDQYRHTAKPYQAPEVQPPVNRPTAKAGAPAVPAPGAAAPSETEVDQNGHDRALWQTQVRDLTDQRADLVKERNELEQKFNQLHYFGRETTEELNLQQAMQAQLDDLTNKINTIDHQLTASLPDEARRAGAPPGWLRN